MNSHDKNTSVSLQQIKQKYFPNKIDLKLQIYLLKQNILIRYGELKSLIEEKGKFFSSQFLRKLRNRCYFDEIFTQRRMNEQRTVKRNLVRVRARHILFHVFISRETENFASINNTIFYFFASTSNCVFLHHLFTAGGLADCRSLRTKRTFTKLVVKKSNKNNIREKKEIEGMKKRWGEKKSEWIFLVLFSKCFQMVVFNTNLKKWYSVVAKNYPTTP